MAQGGYITLGYFDLLLASALLLVNAGLSLRLGLGQERQLVIAAARMCVQLFLIGLVLKALFQVDSLWLTLTVLAIMAAFAGYEVTARQSRLVAPKAVFQVEAALCNLLLPDKEHSTFAASAVQASKSLFVALPAPTFGGGSDSRFNPDGGGSTQRYHGRSGLSFVQVYG